MNFNLFRSRSWLLKDLRIITVNSVDPDQTAHRGGVLTGSRTACHSVCDHHRNDPNSSDRQVLTNNVDPDQAAPRGVVRSGSTLTAILTEFTTAGTPSLRTDRSRQPVYTQIRPLLKDQPEEGPHCLPFCQEFSTAMIPFCFYSGQTSLGKQCRPGSDPQRSGPIGVHTVCHSVCIFWMHTPL